MFVMKDPPGAGGAGRIPGVSGVPVRNLSPVMRRRVDCVCREERERAARALEAGPGEPLLDLESGLRECVRRTAEPERRRVLEELLALTRLCRRKADDLVDGRNGEIAGPEAFREALNEMAGDYRKVFHYRVDAEIISVPNLQEPTLWSELLLLVREGVRNACRHSGGRRMKIHISSDALLLRDDGAGLGEATDGVGCRSLRERAGRLGGRAEILPPPENGWRVRFDLPPPGDGTESVPARRISTADDWTRFLRERIVQERRRIAHDLHDGLSQLLTSLAFQLRAASLRCGEPADLNRLSLLSERALRDAASLHNRYANAAEGEIFFGKAGI